MLAQQFMKTGHESDYMAWWLAQEELRQDRRFNIKGFDITVKKDVFSPDPNCTLSSSYLLDNLPSVEGKTFLDLGTGCGVISLYAASRKASRIIATDTDQAAVANAQDNFLWHPAAGNIVVRRSDLFDEIDESFDIIAANLPIIDIAWPQIKEKTQNIYARFIKELPHHLAEGGAAYLTFASFGDTQGFENLIKNQPLRTEILTQNKFGVNWYVVKFSAGPA